MTDERSHRSSREAESQTFMRRAIELSGLALETGGGPFGAVVVFESQIVGEGMNCVTTAKDPTAHAEILAIRSAANELGRFDLQGCLLYSSCEPCPMCLGAVYWSRIDRVFFANTRFDAAAIGFDDQAFYEELSRQPQERRLQMNELLRDEAQIVFQDWLATDDRQEY